MPAVAVHGLADLNRALARAERETRLGIRRELRQVAEPVRADAEVLAQTRIRNNTGAWSQMRTGATRSVVYVAPRRRGVKRGSPRSRPNMARLLATQAMEPALERNTGRVERELEQVLDRVADRFNRSPF